MIIISVFIFHERKVEISYDFPTRSFSMPSFKLFSSQSLFFSARFRLFFRVCDDSEEEKKTFFHETTVRLDFETLRWSVVL